jgi:hypothetical protein
MRPSKSFCFLNHVAASAPKSLARQTLSIQNRQMSTDVTKQNDVKDVAIGQPSNGAG